VWWHGGVLCSMVRRCRGIYMTSSAVTAVVLVAGGVVSPVTHSVTTSSSKISSSRCWTTTQQHASHRTMLCSITSSTARQTRAPTRRRVVRLWAQRVTCRQWRQAQRPAGDVCQQYFSHYSTTRQHIAYMLSVLYATHRPSVCLSICHTGESIKNNWSLKFSPYGSP